ncbi:MAG: exonuclease domain-containing protein [Oscillospiraceae bacterium]|nr:exonuclease domain-containing protein [Oscillospiraceae bacterium]
MPYIVIDLEWNQAMSSKSSVFNHLPIHLRGEIIQIGAVKLKDDFSPGEEFQCDIRPVWFRKMHYKVKKLTGFDEERLSHGLPFPEAIRQFLDWCGPDCTFMTWGYDDSGIMEQNLIIHDLDIDWIGTWVNLQLIYNKATDGDRNQKSLETAMEHFGIQQTRVAHDALGDAYNTALICSHLDLDEGVAHYDELRSHLSSREALWAGEDNAHIRCPVCGEYLTRSRWVSQGDHRYMALAECGEHGYYLARIRVRHNTDSNTWQANRLLYQADDSMVESFRRHQAHPKKRRYRKKKS